MHRGLLLCLLWASPMVWADPAPQIAIILDDLGYHAERGAEAVRLPGAVTLSFIPSAAHTPMLAAAARNTGKELMIHMPMEPTRTRPLDRGALMLDMDRAEFEQRARAAIAALPQAAGMNNHMGSLLTRHTEVMSWLMEILSEHGDLYFVDSRTDKATVAEATARAMGVPTTRRSVFLDNVRDPQYIRSQFLDLIAKARLRGSAVAIGHPYPETLDILRSELAQLDRHGVELVPVSTLISGQNGRSAWQIPSLPSSRLARR